MFDSKTQIQCQDVLHEVEWAIEIYSLKFREQMQMQ